MYLLVEGVGFEPTKAEPPDLQSGPFGRSGTPPQRKRPILQGNDNDVKSNSLRSRIPANAGDGLAVAADRGPFP